MCRKDVVQRFNFCALDGALFGEISELTRAGREIQRQALALESAEDYPVITAVIPQIPLLHKYYSHCAHSLGTVDVGLIELKQPRNGDPPWIWTCEIWKDHKRQKMK